MSTQYPDLPLTQFPSNGIDTFPNYQNITSTDGNLIAQYMEAMNQGNQVLANQILAQIPNATQKIIKATDLNKVMQAILATERFFKDDIYTYITEQQENWQEIINQFAYVGTYSSGNTYNKYNMVDYTIQGVKLLYIAINNVPVGTPPTTTTYWRVLTIQGTEGEPGQGLSYRQEWQPSVQYDVNQAVTYSAILWMALQPNLGIEPGTNDEIWKKVMDFSVIVYPIQPTPPANQAIGGLWFNTEDNPTDYTYLTPLNTPATSSEVLIGYQAYGENGVVLNGTAQPLDGIIDIEHGGTDANNVQQAIYNLGVQPNKNLLDNAYFTINQKGKTAYYSNDFALPYYTVDRWKTWGNLIINNNEFVTCEVDNQYYRIEQILSKNAIETISKNKITFSMICRGKTGQFIQVIIYKNTIPQREVSTSGIYQLNSDEWELIKIALDVQQLEIIEGEYAIFIYPAFSEGGGRLDIKKAAKLEQGEKQTLARQLDDGSWELLETPDYSAELLKCQRYYQLYSSAEQRPTKAVDCRPMMRIDPTQTTIQIGDATYYVNDANF